MDSGTVAAFAATGAVIFVGLLCWCTLRRLNRWASRKAIQRLHDIDDEAVSSSSRGTRRTSEVELRDASADESARQGARMQQGKTTGRTKRGKRPATGEAQSVANLRWHEDGEGADIDDDDI